jgi:hypothetical protein
MFQSKTVRKSISFSSVFEIKDLNLRQGVLQDGRLNVDNLPEVRVHLHTHEQVRWHISRVFNEGLASLFLSKIKQK